LKSGEPLGYRTINAGPSLIISRGQAKKTARPFFGGAHQQI
jgi:hypothetical protein